MSNNKTSKTLLNETQIRQFMKLAKLEPLTPGFVDGLEERRESRPSGMAHRGTHGRSDKPIPGTDMMAEEEADAEALEDYAAGDEERGHDEEAEHDEMEAADEEGGDERTVRVDDFLAALERALEDAMGEEVEVDASAMEDDAAVDDAAADMDDDMDVDLEVEDDMLEEDKAYTAKKEKPGEDKRKGAEKRGAEGTLAKTKGHGRVDYVNEEEGSKKGEYRRKDKDGKVGHRAGEGKDGHYKDYEGPAGGNKGDKSKTDPGHKDYMKESTATDDLVEAVTKRVAARILKTALKK